MDELKQLETEVSDEIEIDLMELIHVFINKMWIIILCTVILGGTVFAGTKLFITPKYTASSMIYILTKTTSVTSLADIQMGEQLTVDFETLAKSRPVVERVIQDMGLDYTYEDVVGMIETENPEDTRILKFNVTHEDPELAKELANVLAEVTSERVAYIMDTDKPKIVEEAVLPKIPSSPSTLRNTVLGALIGAVLSAGVIMVLYLLNDTIQTEEDVRKYLGLHTLAAIPKEKRR